MMTSRFCRWETAWFDLIIASSFPENCFMHRVIFSAVLRASAFLSVLTAVLSVLAAATVSAAADDRDTCGDWLQGEETVAACTRLIQRNPKDADAYFKRGLYYAVGDAGTGRDYDRAIADFDQAIKLDPGRTEYYSARGDACSNKGDDDRAIADYGEVLKLKPDDAVTYAKRGDIHGDRMDYDRAIADYDQAIRIDANESYYIGRGDIYSRKGDLARAIADYDRAIASDAVDPDHTIARQRREEAQAALAAGGK
jgi:tetratricopeptide (TPR) repeat protein